MMDNDNDMENLRMIHSICDLRPRRDAFADYLHDLLTNPANATKMKRDTARQASTVELDMTEPSEPVEHEARPDDPEDPQDGDGDNGSNNEEHLEEEVKQELSPLVQVPPKKELKRKEDDGGAVASPKNAPRTRRSKKRRCAST